MELCYISAPSTFRIVVRHPNNDVAMIADHVIEWRTRINSMLPRYILPTLKACVSLLTTTIYLLKTASCKNRHPQLGVLLAASCLIAKSSVCQATLALCTNPIWICLNEIERGFASDTLHAKTIHQNLSMTEPVILRGSKRASPVGQRNHCWKQRSMMDGPYSK